MWKLWTFSGRQLYIIESHEAFTLALSTNVLVLFLIYLQGTYVVVARPQRGLDL